MGTGQYSFTSLCLSTCTLLDAFKRPVVSCDAHELHWWYSGDRKCFGSLKRPGEYIMDILFFKMSFLEKIFLSEEYSRENLILRSLRGGCAVLICLLVYYVICSCIRRGTVLDCNHLHTAAREARQSWSTLLYISTCCIRITALLLSCPSNSK